MTRRAIGVAMAAASVLVAASPASADHRGHRHHGHHYRQPYYYAPYPRPYPRPYYWAPPPVVVVPRYYAPPPPVYVYQAPPVIIVNSGAPRFEAWQGSYCQRWKGVAIVDGWRQRVWGTVCLMPDGSWQLVD